MKEPRRAIADFIAVKTLKRGSVDKKLAREVAAYLMSTGRVNELDSLTRDVQEDWAKAGFLEVTAASAETLTAKTRQDIKSLFKRLYPSARSIVITEVHDPSVIGGVRLNPPGRQLDLSIEAKLNRFKQLTYNGKDA